ncbi:MAG: glycosyltransferase family 4 protein [Gemmataceae bacterium]
MTPWVLVAGDVAPTGGMDRANLALAEHLAARGPVHLVTHRAADALAAHQNVTVHPVPRPFGRHFLGERFLARAGVRVARRIPGARVVVNGGNCRWPDVNWVHCVHAAYPALSARPWGRFVHAVHRREERPAIRAARVVVCNSRRTARDVTELLGVPADRVRVVYLGGDPARFPPLRPGERTEARRALGWADRPWVGFVGQLANRVKGFDTLYAAWRELCREPGWDANLAVVGGGAVARWAAQARADGLADRVAFLGHRSDVPDLLAACDLLVHPARYDAYGLAPHEAVCRGLPVLVSAATGFAERLGPDLADAVLTAPEDARLLADRLRAWRRTADAWPARFAGLAADLRAYTWADMAAAVVTAAG